MSDESKPVYTGRKPASIFFPLLLIGVGLVLLLKTMGLISGDLWDMFLKVWPVLLIVSGLDSIFRREGIAGGVVWAGLGTIILLANLGYLPPIYWDIILRIWPFALVVWGIDLLLGKRSWWTTILALLSGMVILGLVYYLITVEPVLHSTQSEKFQTQLEGAKQANIVLEAVAGNLLLQNGAAEDNLADGEFQLLSNEDIVIDYFVQDDTGEFTMKADTADTSEYWVPYTGNKRNWQVNLSETLPLDISSKLVMGEQTADFSKLSLDDAQLETVMGRSVITLPDEATGMIDLNLVMGDMVVYIPEGAAVSIELDTAMTAVDYPNDFERVDDVLYSPGGNAAGSMQVKIELVMGSLRIRYAD